MREPSRLEKHLILGMLTLGCLIVDMGFILGFGAVWKWLADNTSPLALGALVAVVIVTIRVFLSLRFAARAATFSPHRAQ